MKEKALIITHGGDSDGIISAAMLRHILLHSFELETVFVTYSIQEQVFNGISHRYDFPETEVFVLDLSLNDYLVEVGELGESIISRLARRAKSLTWVDHHSGTEKYKQLLESLGAEVIFDSRRCASKLIFDIWDFSNNYTYFHWLSSVAQNSDGLSTQSDEKIDLVGRDLYDIISFLLYEDNLEELRRLVNTLSTSSYWFGDGQYIEGIKNLLAQAKAEQKRLRPLLDQSLETIEIAGRKIMIGYGPGVLPDKEAIAEVMRGDRESADCYIIPFGTPINNALVLRPSKSNFPVRVFCMFMGGGGREYESGQAIGGFSFNFIFTEENFFQARQQVVDGLERFFK
ncbi:hypothetical protein COV49_02950 [Candidatus Falkowbacteria bacterium CG11_big_fil_rev_8_21_14_0_20_39_10]|uniref:DHHA1 domain-containing protein n=1 Tax=Candidatus Falkowbacteria bacterium CG11_big_fil_rev_8_21_14_0_20_39_10 TaxID=1974570 RepID=A0A2M6K8R8_9BACT|nr:MAG: hypothetical protein COV49_02950 [Candidatus Falkowbacteria bacterium CG11_big_fil_rev_8_21_14_0_20_39_10]